MTFCMQFWKFWGLYNTLLFSIAISYNVFDQIGGQEQEQLVK